MKVFTMYMIGLSGSGKSTLAAVLEKRLRERGVPLQVIDGDRLRRDLGELFGYTKEERLKQGRVALVLAKYLNQNGISVIITAVAGYREAREQARRVIDKESYIQAYLDCTVEECAHRDVKGYYSNIGQMKNFCGSDQPYEVPADSEITVDVMNLNVEASAEQVFTYLQKHGYVE